MKLVVDNMWTYIQFESTESKLKVIVEDNLHFKLGIKPKGVEFSPAYKRGHWDGITDFYDKEFSKFPTGLLGQVEDILGEIQNNINFQFQIIDNRPDPLITLDEVPDKIELNGGIILRDYQQEAVESLVENRVGIWHLSTNSGKSLTSAGLSSLVIPKLQGDEIIGLFSHSKEIFSQLADTYEKALGIKVGRVQSGKPWDIQKVTVFMIPTVASALRVEDNKFAKFSERERTIRVLNDLSENILNGINQKSILQNTITNFIPKTKADKLAKEEMIKILETSKNNNNIIYKFEEIRKEYISILRDKNNDKIKKKYEMKELLSRVVLGVFDEAHHIQGEGYYNTLLACENSLMRVGLTGTIDKDKELGTQRLLAGFGGVVHEVSNKEMIARGISADPTILMVPIDRVQNDEEDVDFIEQANYQTAYSRAIVKNRYRNGLISKFAEMWYNKGAGVLIIIQRIEQGEQIKELLNALGVPTEFIHGSSEDEHRENTIQAMKDGELKVLIASTILDEGVDISGIDVLIMGAGNKSLRETLQRVGRGLRRKEGDNTLTVIDFIDKTNKYLYNHSKERLTIYKEEDFDIKFM